MWFVLALACQQQQTAEGIQIGATTSLGPRGQVRVLSGAALAAGRTEIMASYVGTDDGPLNLEGAEVVGDLDGDQVDDLIVSTGSGSRFGSGATLGASGPFDWPTVADGAPIGDVTGDGVIDIGGFDDIYSGAGLLTDEPPVATFVREVDFALYAFSGGDVNGDGIGDLVAQRRHSTTTFTSVVRFGPIAGEIELSAGDVVLPGAATAVGDLDGDGADDVGSLVPGVYLGEMSTAVSLFTGASLTPGAVLDPEDATWTVNGDELDGIWVRRSADVDGDGRDDLWITFLDDLSPGRTDVFSGAELEGRTFGAADLTFPFYSVHAAAVADFDDDGAPEVALGHLWEVGLYLDPAFDRSSDTNPDAAVPCSKSPQPQQIGDVNGDRIDDLVIWEADFY